MWFRILIVFMLPLSVQSSAQEPDRKPDDVLQTSETNSGNGLSAEEKDARTELAIQLRDAYWEKNDKKGLKRKAEPELFDVHDAMTREWVEKLKESDFLILTKGDQDEEEAKRAKELQRIYTRKSLDVSAQIAIYKKLSRKIITAHWNRLNQNGITRDSAPEFAKEFDETINDWFKSQTLEDLEIFEKPKPTESERDRGAKITKELLEKIEEVKRKFGI